LKGDPRIVWRNIVVVGGWQVLIASESGRRQLRMLSLVRLLFNVRDFVSNNVDVESLCLLALLFELFEVVLFSVCFE
jgi:hypothetical protein